MSIAPESAATFASEYSSSESPPWESPEWQEAVRQNPALTPFFDNLESFVELPNGVDKLRALILDLAYRGKLTTRENDDEPAWRMLQRVAESIEHLVATKKLAKPKKSAPIDKTEVPFPAPLGWQWCRLGDWMNANWGDTALTKRAFIDKGILAYSAAGPDGFLDHADFDCAGVVISAIGARCGRCFLADGQWSAIKNTMTVVEYVPDTAVVPLVYLFCSIKDNFPRRGGAQPFLSLKDVRAFPLPVPPLAEQRRIVAKVESLMSLCDTLESYRRARERVREQASRSVLASLTSASAKPPSKQKASGDVPRTETLASAWQRLSDHFEVLLDQPEDVPHLRQAILALVLDGHFTVDSYGPTEDAHKLVSRIRHQRRESWEQQELGKLKSSGKKLTNDDWKKKYKTPFSVDVCDLPQLKEGWCWASLDELTKIITSGSRGWRQYYADSGSLFIRSQDIKYDYLDVSTPAFVNVPDSTEGKRTRVQRGDVLVTITGANVAKAAYVRHELEEAFVSQHVALLKLVSADLSPFVHYWLISEMRGRGRLLQRSYGDKPGLNLDNIRTLPIALPPLAEQKRIVSKADNLLSKCDELAARLRSRQSTTDALLTALIHQILEGTP